MRRGTGSNWCDGTGYSDARTPQRWAGAQDGPGAKKSKTELENEEEAAGEGPVLYEDPPRSGGQETLPRAKPATFEICSWKVMGFEPGFRGKGSTG